MKESPFSNLSDDVLLQILFKLQGDPRNWARLACVSAKFSTLIRTICCRSRCLSIVPSVAADLSISSPAGDHPPGGWAALHKITVCCPGLLHAGVLLDNSDFGLQRELGPDEIYRRHQHKPAASGSNLCSSSSNQRDDRTSRDCHQATHSGASGLCWSLYDDLYYDTVYDTSDSQDCRTLTNYADGDEATNDAATASEGNCSSDARRILASSKKRKTLRPMRSHLASGAWSLSREQGNKLLASRFREDSLYICDWPGCIHMEEKRNYMLFRGIFKNFKRSRVWRTINDGQRSRIDLSCAYCDCKETWDLHSAFCLRRVFGYHDDGDPVVRAYVCENGHVSGAWTDLPLYT